MMLCLLGVQAARAQPVRHLETSFERDVNRYRWRYGLQVAQQVGAWQLALTNRFRSDAFILFDDRYTFRDENQLVWSADRSLPGALSLRSRGTLGWFSQSDVFSQELYGGVRYAPTEYAWVEPSVGLAMDQRSGAAPAGEKPPLRFDAGPAYGLRFTLTPPVDGYQIRLEGDAAWQSISPRRGRGLYLNGALGHRIEETQLTARVRLASVRRDAYQAVSFLNRDDPTRQPETIEATTSDTLEATVELDAPVYRHFHITSRIDVEAGNRFIRTEQAPDDALFFETDFRRRAADGELAVRYQRPRLMGRLAARAGAATERRQLANREDLPPTEAAQKGNLLQQADYDEGSFSLRTRLRGEPLRRLVLTFDGAARIIRHDTPEANPDDRDEVFYTGEVGALLRLSRYLEADLKAYGSYNHTVYINAERSAENNVQRSLRLRPSIRWTPSSRTRVEVAPEVRATYTVDDFVLPGRRSTDQSAREVRMAGAVEQEVAEGLRVLGDGSYSDLRLGRLLWDTFAEIPFDTLRTYSGWLRVQAQVTPRLFAETGVRLFIRSDFDRATTVRYARVGADGEVLRDEAGAVLLTSITREGRQIIEQIGPTTSLTWSLPGGSALRVEGWLYVQHTWQRLYGDLPDDAADRITAAARDGSRRIVPNLTVTARWAF
ncbi:MAG: hypothetical protein GVY18_11325 [Bacteroidetes bacterium]|jgi:hypothetical protein|nr:hypothetical protein [Bacteroidota bacterium]